MTRRAELYQLTFPNGKIYLGITTKSTSARWGTHKYNASRGHKTPLCDAIRSFGADSVVVKTLAVGSRQYILDLEVAAIAQYGSNWPDVGYNLCPGGEIAPTIVPEIAAKVSASMMGNQNCVGFRHSPETRAKLSAAKMGNRGPLGHKQSEEHKRKRMEARRRWMESPEGVAARVNPNMARNFSAESRAKISASLRAAHARRKQLRAEETH